MKSERKWKQDDILITAKTFVNMHIANVFVYAGYKMAQEYNQVLTHSISLRWMKYYGGVYIRAELKINKKVISEFPKDFQFFGRNDFVYDCDQNENFLLQQFLASTIKRMENELLDRYKGIFEWTNTYDFCSVPGCLHNNFPTVCTIIGDKHVCDNCIDKFSLSVDNTPKPKKISKAQTERSKMSASLRYDILERDGFKCNYCGASPELDNDIQLHVDHIIPVSKGGKTEWDNLQVLCQKCNLGKSNKIPLAA